jgi:hypothetical protein
MATKLSDTAYDELLFRIISCQYPPGSLLSEEKLVAELGISRTPIRSALIRLQQEHLVQIISKKGILVSEITPEGIRDLFNLRDLIEPYAIREFGGNFKKDKLIYYLNLFSKKYSKDDYQIVYDSDVQFHTDIVQLTGNTFLCSFYNSLQKLLSRITLICGISVTDRVVASNQEHVEIVLSLLKDDKEFAVAMLETHLKEARESAYQAILIQKDRLPESIRSINIDTLK